MKKINSFIFMVVMLCIPLVGYSQQDEAGIDPMLSTEPVKMEPKIKVTAVYGVTADDYLPSIAPPRQNISPNVRRSSTRPNFDFPDAFYYIGGPVFLVILLGVLVIFLNGFEEKRKEEERAAANLNLNPE